MAVEAELKKDHEKMQDVIETKQKIIDAQVRSRIIFPSPPFFFGLQTPLPHSPSLASALQLQIM